MNNIQSVGDFKTAKHCYMIEMTQGIKVEAAKLAKGETGLEVRSVNMIG